MGEAVLILGHSGSGKSTSLRNFNKDELGVLNVANKRLPFKNDFNLAYKANNKDMYDLIHKVFKNNKLNTYVIDDSQYLMAFENFNRATEPGYKKFTEMAQSFYRVIQQAKATNNNTIVYFLHHLDEDVEGRMKTKTIGKMLDDQLVVEGLFSIVLRAVKAKDGYKFITNGQEPFKSPIDMFPEVIDNDLKMVDTTIREYYNMK